MDKHYHRHETLSGEDRVPPTRQSLAFAGTDF